MKEEFLEKLDAMSFEEYRFRWENAHRLSIKEVQFLLGVMSRALIFSKCVNKLLGGNESRLKTLIDEIVAEDKLEVMEMTLNEDKKN